MSIDPHSPTWAAVVAWAESEIAHALTTLEQPGLDVARTELERGRLLAMRDLLKLGKPQPLAPRSRRETYGLATGS